VIDSKGASNSAPLLFVSEHQVTFQIPATTAAGLAQVKVTAPVGTQTTSNVTIASVAPALFTVNGSSLAAAYAVRVSGDKQIVEPAYDFSSTGGFVAAPISMGSGTDRVFLSLFGTGFQNAGIATLTATVQGVSAQVVYVGPQGSVPGLDQINIQLPASLAGSGNVNIQLTASGVTANQVQITIQ
jgi:uncharacterized protein (TIGR03437 family)